MTTRFAHTSLFRHLLIMLVAGLFTLGPALQDAEASRLGGGKSFGHFPAQSAAGAGDQCSTSFQNAVGHDGLLIC